MDDIKNKKPILYHGRKPVTRREFLASGAVPFMAWVAAPSLLTTFAKSGIAQAQDLCKVNAAVQLPPVVTVNLSGGWRATGNWIALTEGRELLPHYGIQGLGSAANLVSMIVKDGHFRNKPPFYSGSGFLAGVQTSLVPNLASSALAKTDFIGMPVQSQNDSDINKFDISFLLGKAGMVGKVLPAMGTFDNGIGVSNSSAFAMPKAPLIVRNVDNIVNALGVGDRLAQLNNDQKTKMFKASQRLSEIQARKLASMTGGSLLNRLLGQANVDNTNLIANPSGLDVDPISNPAFAAVWGLNANTGRGSQDYVNAALVYNAIKGNSGSIGIELGGYDYHGNDLASTIAMDNAAGVVISRILQSFHVMNSPGFVVVNSDGGVGAPRSDIPGVDPTGDRGDAGGIYMMAYDPDGSSSAIDSQVGHMKNDPDAEAADDRYLVGGNPEIAAAAVFANYLSYAGKLGVWSTIPETNRLFDAAQLEKLVKVHGKSKG